MGLFGKRAPPVTEAQAQAAARDLERIAAGGIPVGAEERLKAIAQMRSPFFTSDLSVNEYALADASGLTPVAQVMGSSVVQHGWQNYAWAAYQGGIREMQSFAAPWNLARTRAFDRLYQEASLAAADAVIGIELSVGGVLGESGNVEYAVFGTAVRESTLAAPAASGPRLCALSGQDVDKLRRIGAETVGVVGHTAVVCVALGPASNRVMRSWGAGRANQEMTEITEGVYAARRLAMEEVRRQGTQAGANDLVISQLRHSIHHHEYESSFPDNYGNKTHHFFIVTLHILGTAIRLGAHDPHPSPLGTPVLALNLGA